MIHFALKKLQTFFILWLIFFSILTNAGYGQQSEAEKYLDDASQYFKHGEYEKVITSCKKAIETDANYVPAYFAMGRAYTILNRFQEAISILEKGLSLNPNYVDFYLGLGPAYGKIGEYQKGISTLKKALEIEPDNATAYVALAGIYEELKLYHKCFLVLEKAAELAPDYGDVYAGFGDYYRKLKQPDRAKENYKKAINIYNSQGLKDLVHEYQKRLKEIDMPYIRVYLKSGTIIEGRVTEATDTYIKIKGDMYSELAGGFVAGFGGENKYNKTDIRRIESVELN